MSGQPPEKYGSSPPGSQEARILALDVGEKRIGLAVSDPLRITAQGLGVLIRQGREADLDRLLQIARDYHVKEIVVGLPRHMDGRMGKMAPEILELATSLGEALRVKVTPWDERLTSVEAERVLIQADLSRRKRRKVIDQLAAVLILQGYLDYSRRE
jgi:putative Holliday junction resolvase